MLHNNALRKFDIFSPVINHEYQLINQSHKEVLALKHLFRFLHHRHWDVEALFTLSGPVVPDSLKYDDIINFNII